MFSMELAQRIPDASKKGLPVCAAPSLAQTSVSETARQNRPDALKCRTRALACLKLKIVALRLIPSSTPKNLLGSCGPI